MRGISKIIIIAGLTAVLASAQSESHQATIRGSRGDRGKCTMEVDVDGVVEIQITGARADLHTLQGTPARFVRFECNDTPPRYPDDFKFRGVDGRGRQTLIRDPRDNRGVALIRIEDPKSGHEGYTFDIEWTGYSNSKNNIRPGGSNINNGKSGSQGGFGNLDRRYGINDNERNASATDQAMDLCAEAVRTKASRENSYKNIDITNIGLDNNPGRRDWVIGRFSYRQGQSLEEFEFNCSVDFNNGRVRSVDFRRW